MGSCGLFVWVWQVGDKLGGEVNRPDFYEPKVPVKFVPQNNIIGKFDINLQTVKESRTYTNLDDFLVWSQLRNVGRLNLVIGRLECVDVVDEA